MHTNYYQLPPDGVGKKVFARKSLVLNYNNGVVAINEGDIVVGNTSNLSMMVLTKAGDTSTGRLYVSYTNEQNEVNLSYSPGEQLLVNGIICAYVNGTPEHFYTPIGNITSFNNPYNGLMIDEAGQAFTRYGEGSQLLDGGGRTKHSESKKIGIYGFDSGTATDVVSYVVTGGGTYTNDTVNRGLKLSVDSASGSSISIISNRYHPFMIDQALYMEMSLNTSDNGKPNLIRRGGMYDDTNGFFFELNGTTGLNFKTRSNSTGTIVEQSVHQSEFNGDRADGTGLSRQMWDFTKINKYWIDFYSGSRIRFGGYDHHGNRVIFHTMTLGNLYYTRPMNLKSLPVRFDMENTGVTSGSSDMMIYGIVVMAEGNSEYKFKPFEVSRSSTLVTSAAFVPMISVKTQPTNSFGDIDRTLAHLSGICISAVKAANEDIDGRVKIEIMKDPVLTGATWDIQRTNSSCIVDTAATSLTGGTPIYEFFVKGTDNIKLAFDMLMGLIHCKADGTPKIFTVAVKALSADCNVDTAIVWKEIG